MVICYGGPLRIPHSKQRSNSCTFRQALDDDHHSVLFPRPFLDQPGSLDAPDSVTSLCAAFADAPEELDATLFAIHGSSVSAVERGASELVAQVSAKGIANIGHEMSHIFEYGLELGPGSGC